MIGRIRNATGGDSTAAFLILAGAALLGAIIILALPNAKRTMASAAPSAEQA